MVTKKIKKFGKHHTSKLARNFWYTFQSVQVSAPHKALVQMVHLNSFFLKFQSKLLAKRVFCLNAACVMAILDIISRVRLRYMLSCYPNSLNSPHLSGSFIYHNLYCRWLLWASHCLSLFPHSLFRIILIWIIWPVGINKLSLFTAYVRENLF
jgi:hypothetical protein